MWNKVKPVVWFAGVASLSIALAYIGFAIDRAWIQYAAKGVCTCPCQVEGEGE